MTELLRNAPQFSWILSVNWFAKTNLPNRSVELSELIRSNWPSNPPRGAFPKTLLTNYGRTVHWNSIGNDRTCDPHFGKRKPTLIESRESTDSLKRIFQTNQLNSILWVNWFKPTGSLKWVVLPKVTSEQDWTIHCTIKIVLHTNICWKTELSC